ncbi:hypothetical protein JFL43_13485 [Viridibacillus sp. YIM B01967]|uniref:Uncharacterized protein n=1 Tax=Viridibacillus soli TaxID=2798301 RepID=A0ABS1H8W0_9BACL|nr:hypothetical protein [Viridibacillus soli]MBK3495851.1 hypothetical protein [Viridibacillus soli]
MLDKLLRFLGIKIDEVDDDFDDTVKRFDDADSIFNRSEDKEIGNNGKVV